MTLYLHSYNSSLAVLPCQEQHHHVVAFCLVQAATGRLAQSVEAWMRYGCCILVNCKLSARSVPLNGAIRQRQLGTAGRRSTPNAPAQSPAGLHGQGDASETLNPSSRGSGTAAPVGQGGKHRSTQLSVDSHICQTRMHRGIQHWHSARTLSCLSLGIAGARARLLDDNLVKPKFRAHA